jgi:hypothetical protein
VDDAHDATQRAVEAGRARNQVCAPVLVELDGEAAAPGRLLERRERRALDLDPVVAEEQRAQGLPDRQRTLEV